MSRKSFNRALISGTGGNISVRIPGTDKILITPSGISLGDVKAEVLRSMRGSERNQYIYHSGRRQ